MFKIYLQQLSACNIEAIYILPFIDHLNLTSICTQLASISEFFYGFLFFNIVKNTTINGRKLGLSAGIFFQPVNCRNH